MLSPAAAADANSPPSSGVGCRESQTLSKLCRPAGQVDNFADKVGVDLLAKFVDAQVDVFHARRQFRRVKIS